MSQFIGIEITGTEELLRDFKGYEKEAEAAVKKAIDDTSKFLQNDARNRLKGMFGSKKHIISNRLRADVYNRWTEAGKEKRVGSETSYAPYIEFGTGDLVFQNFNFSGEARQVASQFKGAGIRKVNIRGDSFLNWAAVNQAKKFRERIIQNLNKINR